MERIGRRQSVIAAAALLGGVSGTGAQQAGRTPRIGYLTERAGPTAFE